MFLPGYDIGKAAQVAAFFTLKSGRSIKVLKLSKLLYLAERESMNRYDIPMFYDVLYSMDEGPVVSTTLDLIDGDQKSPIWSKFMSARSAYDVGVKADVNFELLDRLSDADVEILEQLWAKFALYDRFELANWTHVKGNIPEWEDPNGSSLLIPHCRVFEALGKKDGKALARDIEDYRDLSENLIDIA